MFPNEKEKGRCRLNGIGIFTGILMVLAAWFDWRSYRIPNWLIGIGLSGGLVFQISQHGVQGVAWWLTEVCGICILVLPFCALGMFGAGDGKLAMVVGGIHGCRFTLKFLFISLLIGAVFSLWKMHRHHNLKYRLQYLANYIFLIWTKKQLVAYQKKEEVTKEQVIPFAVPMVLAFVYQAGIERFWL